MTGDHARIGKADFDDIYDMPDPRGYYRTLGELDYEVPDRAQPVLRSLLAARRQLDPDRDEPQRVFDVCCSYGINAALLRYELTFADVQRHYAGLDGLSVPELRDADGSFYADRARREPVRVAGLDIAQQAIAYGSAIGLLDTGFAEDLENDEPSAGCSAELSRVDLIATTGGVGYVTDRTFDRLLRPAADRAGEPPWVAALVLRMFPYDDIATTLAGHGLVTERLDGVTFPQRRFADADEQIAAVRAVGARGLATSGLEDDGGYHADLFVSRPPSEVARQPLKALLMDAAAG